MMPKTSASRLRRARLRVLPGGLPLPVEKIDPRSTAALKAGALIRIALSVLALALVLNLAAAVALYWQREHSLPLALPMIGASAGVIALGAVLIARARQHLVHIAYRSRHTRQGNDWDTSCSHTA